MNTNILFNLGKNIKRYRLECGLTQEKLAEKAKVHPTYIGKIELGMINPSVKRLFIISRALNVKLTDIFDFDK